MPGKSTALVYLTLALALPGCSSLGSTPPLVELYDLADPEGGLEIELDRSGRVTELEAEIRIDQLPKVVVDAALARLEGAELVGAEREIGPHGRVWEVKLRHDSVVHELVIDSRGIVRESERPLAREAAPGIVLGNAASMVQTHAGDPGSFVSVEELRTDDQLSYHVKHRVGAVTYKVVLAGDGSVIRTVREHRAEIEIPLR